MAYSGARRGTLKGLIVLRPSRSRHEGGGVHSGTKNAVTEAEREGVSKERFESKRKRRSRAPGAGGRRRLRETSEGVSAFGRRPKKLRMLPTGRRERIDEHQQGGRFGDLGGDRCESAIVDPSSTVLGDPRPLANERRRAHHSMLESHKRRIGRVITGGKRHARKSDIKA